MWKESFQRVERQEEIHQGGRFAPTGQALISCFYVALLTEYSKVKMPHCPNALQLG